MKVLPCLLGSHKSRFPPPLSPAPAVSPCRSYPAIYSVDCERSKLRSSHLECIARLKRTICCFENFKQREGGLTRRGVLNRLTGGTFTGAAGAALLLLLTSPSWRFFWSRYPAGAFAKRSAAAVSPLHATTSCSNDRSIFVDPDTRLHLNRISSLALCVQKDDVWLNRTERKRWRTARRFLIKDFLHLSWCQPKAL